MTITLSSLPIPLQLPYFHPWQKASAHLLQRVWQRRIHVCIYTRKHLLKTRRLTCAVVSWPDARRGERHPWCRDQPCLSRSRGSWHGEPDICGDPGPGRSEGSVMPGRGNGVQEAEKTATKRWRCCGVVNAARTWAAFRYRSSGFRRATVAGGTTGARRPCCSSHRATCPEGGTRGYAGESVSSCCFSKGRPISCWSRDRSGFGLWRMDWWWTRTLVRKFKSLWLGAWFVNVMRMFFCVLIFLLR